MTDYGDEQRRARLHNERLLYNWRAHHKPTLTIRWRWLAVACVVGGLVWVVVILLLKGG